MILSKIQAMAKKSSENPNFETSLKELEALVEKMEQGDLSLEESLSHFERGVQLSRACQLALKAAGLAGGTRVREAVALLLDRMIPRGGWNQSNKIILGSVLRPHVQPTGLALAALHGETQAGRHAIRSIEYLKRMVSARTATASLSYGVLGAAAHGVKLPSIDRYLAAAACRTLEGDGSPYKLALLGLAAKGDDCPWFKVV